MKVSVIVPVCNTEKYLRQCLDSLACQTLKDIEIICVDDGSTDSSSSIIDEYVKRDPRFKAIHKKNTGYGNSMNLGFDTAEGEYIGILESDDFAQTDMYEKLYLTAKKFNADVVKADFFEYDDSLSKVTNKHGEISSFATDGLFDIKENPQIFGVHPSVWSSIYCKNFIEQNKIRFLETPGASYQDIGFAFKVFSCANSLVLLQDALINYRVNNTGSSIHNPNKIFCVCDELAEIEEFIKRRPDIQGRLEITQIADWIKFRNYIWNFERLDIAFQYAFLLKVYPEIVKINERNHKADLWSPTELHKLTSISENMMLYYQQYRMDKVDSRIELLKVFNNSFSVDRFDELIDSFENISIYGAGIIGSKVKDYLEIKNAASKLKQFIVTENPQLEIKDNIPVCKLDLVKNSDLKDNLIIVATQKKFQYDIASLLEKSGALNVVLIDDKIKKHIEDRRGCI